MDGIGGDDDDSEGEESKVAEPVRKRAKKKADKETGADKPEKKV